MVFEFLLHVAEKAKTQNLKEKSNGSNEGPINNHGLDGLEWLFTASPNYYFCQYKSYCFPTKAQTRASAERRVSSLGRQQARLGEQGAGSPPTLCGGCGDIYRCVVHCRLNIICFRYGPWLLLLTMLSSEILVFDDKVDM
jgi:hypothetical protein